MSNTIEVRIELDDWEREAVVRCMGHGLNQRRNDKRLLDLAEKIVKAMKRAEGYGTCKHCGTEIDEKGMCGSTEND